MADTAPESRQNEPVPRADHQTTLRETFHNLQTPLAVTKGYVQTLSKNWDKLNDEQRRGYVEKALDAAGHIVSALARSEITLAPLIRAGADAMDERKRDLEDALSTVRGVRAAKVYNPIDEDPQVDVLIVPERAVESPEVVDEVRNVANGLAVEVPPENIRVVTVPGGGGSQYRRKLVGVATQRSEEAFVARVWLERHGDMLVGEAVADHTPGAQYKAASQAVLDAVRNLMPGEAKVLGVDLLRIGSVGTATVAIAWNDRRLIGTAELQRDQYDAIARATLDAINRFISPRT